MVKPKINMIGSRFHRLVVEAYAPDYIAPDGKHFTNCLCRCDCGKEKIIRSDALKSGGTVSCGCLSREKHTTHHGTKERLFKVWRDMRNRCYNPNRESYKHYGAKGVRICDEWRDDYPKFREWALANGYDENAPRSQCTIDRINPFGDYEPSNCRWADAKTQARNRRSNYVKRDYDAEDSVAAHAYST